VQAGSHLDGAELHACRTCRQPIFSTAHTTPHIIQHTWLQRDCARGHVYRCQCALHCCAEHHGRRRLRFSCRCCCISSNTLDSPIAERQQHRQAHKALSHACALLLLVLELLNELDSLQGEGKKQCIALHRLWRHVFVRLLDKNKLQALVWYSI
jgi:hypothetical protein